MTHPQQNSMDDAEREMERLARKLGGGWRIEHGVIPVLVLTMVEAQALERRLREDDDGA